MRADCDRRLRELDAAIPSVSFGVTNTEGTPVRDVFVTVDGAPLNRALSEPVELDPGEHVFTFVANGYAPKTSRMSFVEGARDVRSYVILDNARTVAPARAGDVRDGPSWRVPVGIGLGVLGASVAGYFTEQSLRYANRCEPACPDAAARMDLERSVALAILGGVWFLTGVVFILVDILDRR